MCRLLDLPLPTLPNRRGDLDLWSRWLRFCQRTGSNKQMSKVLTKALQLHSACAPLWTYAAAWEFEHNLNAVAARALMQRGLRMCKHAPQVGRVRAGVRAVRNFIWNVIVTSPPADRNTPGPALVAAPLPRLSLSPYSHPTSHPPPPKPPPQLWHEYFRLELLYALRLRERRRVLGIAAGDDDGLDLSLGAATATSEGGKEGEEEGEEGDETGAAVAAVLNGAVALVVYRSAIAAVPDSVPFRAKFLELLAPLEFPGRAALEVSSVCARAAVWVKAGLGCVPGWRPVI